MLHGKPEGAIPLYVRGLAVKAAARFVDQHHVHHSAPRGALFASCVVDADDLVHCVAIMGRPKSRLLQEAGAVEVVRVASDGTPNAASMATAALTRGALALGWQRIVTYTILGEAGTSYRATGWRVTALTEGGEWGRTGRERETAEQGGVKVRWEIGPAAAPLDVEADRQQREMIGKVEIKTRLPAVSGVPQGCLLDPDEDGC